MFIFTAVRASDLTCKLNFVHPIFSGLAGSASYIVFMTDYENYGGLFTCQKLGFAHRQSASILSRSPRLDKMYVDKVREFSAIKNVYDFRHKCIFMYYLHNTIK
jgi:hypothetical protein